MTLWARVPEVLWREGLGTVVLLPPGASDPLRVSQSGALLWDLLAEPSTPDAVVAALGDLYDLQPAQIATEVTLALEELEGRGALRRLP